MASCPARILIINQPQTAHGLLLTLRHDDMLQVRARSAGPRYLIEVGDAHRIWDGTDRRSTHLEELNDHVK